MSHAIVMQETGGPEVLRYQSVPITKPGPEEVVIQQTAIGVNFIDIYQRKGLYPVTLPAILGSEAVGYIESTGSLVGGFQPGDRVAYATAPMGAYTQYRTLDNRFIVSVPPEITDEVAASCLLKGMTAHYLVRRCYMVQPGDRILVHAAAGATGQFLCQWLRFLDAKLIIGTVGSEEKKAVALSAGCHHVINYSEENWAEQVRELTKGIGVHAVYDSVGKNTFMGSLECLSYYGILVSYGQSSGTIPAFDLSLLTPKCNYITRPSLFTYKADRMELILSAHEIFEMIKKGVLQPPPIKQFKLSEAAKAHHALENRKTAGAIVLKA